MIRSTPPSVMFPFLRRRDFEEHYFIALPNKLGENGVDLVLRLTPSSMFIPRALQLFSGASPRPASCR
jgi:hypothetical protein